MGSQRVWHDWATFTFFPVSHVLCAVLSHSVVSDSLWPRGLQPARFLCPRGFSRQGYWSGLPCSLPGDLPHPGFEPTSLMSHVPIGRFFTTWEDYAPTPANPCPSSYKTVNWAWTVRSDLVWLSVTEKYFAVPRSNTHSSSTCLDEGIQLQSRLRE